MLDAGDLTKGPLVVRVPTLTESRWYIVQIGSYYDQIVYNIGGSKGPEPGLFLLTGPDYHGSIPAGMKEIKVPTELAVIGNRIFVNGETDLLAARAVQQGFQLLPLSAFQSQGLRFEVPKQSDYDRFEFKPAAPEALQLLEKIGFGMKTFLSPTDDFADPYVGAAQQIGLSVANGFEWRTLDEPTRRGLARAALTADAIIADTYANAAENVNGWRYTMGGGRVGFNYGLRAAFVNENHRRASICKPAAFPHRWHPRIPTMTNTGIIATSPPPHGEATRDQVAPTILAFNASRSDG